MEEGATLRLLDTRKKEADHCVIVEEMRRFLRLSRRRQPSSILRAPYRQAAPQVISAYRALCRQQRGRR